MIVVNFPIQGPDGSSFDTRVAPILIAGYFSGPLAGGIAAAAGVIARLEVGGPAAVGGAASFVFYLFTALLFRRFLKRLQVGFFSLCSLAVAATVMVIPAFFIGQSIDTGWRILSTFWPVLLTGNVLGTVGLGLLVEQMRSFNAKKREYQAIVSSSPDGIVTVAEDLTIQTMNPKAEKLFGWSAAEATGKNINIFLPQNMHERHVRDAEDFVSDSNTEMRKMTGYRIVEGVRKDGSVLPVLVSLAKYTVRGELIVAATVHDMTEIQSARSDLLKMTDQLALKLNEALAASEAKNRFLANMSHELRTPLNAIIGYSDFLSSTRLEKIAPEKALEYLQDIQDSGKLLLQMINNILDISKIEEDQLDISIEQLSISELVRSSIKTLQPSADSRQIRIQLFLPDDVQAYGDSVMLHQVILNVVSNAIKYSPVASVVTIEINDDVGEVRIIINDEGIGIPQFVIDRLGEPFLRGDSPDVRLTEGSGLGLALSKSLIERQNGALKLHRLKPNGTQAVIHLRKNNDNLPVPPGQAGGTERSALTV